MTSLAERIATLALSKFDSLPQRCKPREQDDGREWTPMSAIILSKGEMEELTCICVATGTKCLAASTIPNCFGSILHDSHAETLALRGFNFWLLSEAQGILADCDMQSDFIENASFNVHADTGNDDASNPPFKLKDDVYVHFFTTEAPCGDASMEILMRSFASEDTTPWPVDAAANGSESGRSLLGRSNFSLLGHVRRKPARADAEPSISKSCTDKLALKQFMSILSFPTDIFFQRTPNTFIKDLVLYPHQYDSVGFDRAFGPSGRLAVVGINGNHFDCRLLPDSFPLFRFNKVQGSNSQEAKKPKTSNVSALWIKGPAGGKDDTLEILINGVKQGFKQLDGRKKKGSVLCRRNMWTLGRDVCGLLIQHRGLDSTSMSPKAETFAQPMLYGEELRSWFRMKTYNEAKSSKLREKAIERKTIVITSLGNWIANVGDGDWEYH